MKAGKPAEGLGSQRGPWTVAWESGAGGSTLPEDFLLLRAGWASRPLCSSYQLCLQTSHSCMPCPHVTHTELGTV